MTAPSNLPHAFHCANHPRREGVGICVGCRAVVCVECATKIDGMNYCIACLRSAAPRTAAPDDHRKEVLLGIPLLIGVFLAAALVFSVMGVVLAGFRSGAPG